jgi:hypothetical protein
MNIVDWSGFTFTPVDPAPPVLVGINARRTCPQCNDADGQVLWYGPPVCPWCGYSKGDTC